MIGGIAIFALLLIAVLCFRRQAQLDKSETSAWGDVVRLPIERGNVIRFPSKHGRGL